MRIVQIIDSLEAGGAERMAVNYANALALRIEFSGLVSTRAEGSLKSEIYSNVNYMFLKKKHALDFSAVRRLARYCRENQVTHIHAHSTSYFIAILVKFIFRRIKIIWHDHNGNSEFLEVRDAVPLNVCSFLFCGIIVVNNQLKEWALRELHCANVLYIPNFTHFNENGESSTVLQGQPGKRILHLANLREQKNHFFLIEVALLMKQTHPEWTFHLVGKDFNDDYSAKLIKSIKSNNLEKSVLVYGSKSDTANIIRQCDIAVLTSKSEGLPVALLEYGLQRKPVVVTHVGDIPLIVEHAKNGFIVPKGDISGFADCLKKLADDRVLRETIADNLYTTILEGHSEEAAMNRYLNWIESASHV